MTCLLEVPKHTAFLYVKPGCLELWIASRDKSECINYFKKHKVTQTKNRAFGFFRKQALAQDCSTFASTSKICARAFEQRLNFASISKIRGTICYPLSCPVLYHTPFPIMFRALSCPVLYHVPCSIMFRALSCSALYHTPFFIMSRAVSCSRSIMSRALVDAVLPAGFMLELTTRRITRQIKILSGSSFKRLPTSQFLESPSFDILSLFFPLPLSAYLS